MRNPRLVPAAVGLAVAMLVAAPTPAAAMKRFAGPAPNLVFQFQKQDFDRPWLRITADSVRLELSAGRIDEVGLSELQSRPGSPLPPRVIRWRSIERIDEVVTLANRGRVLGFILGAAIGAGIGNTIGSGIRTPSTISVPGAEGTVAISEGHGGLGAALGIVLFGGLGARQGRRWGERRAHERLWYLGTPIEASEDTVPDSPIALDPAPPARPSSSPPGHAPSPSVLRASARIGRDDLIRVQGDFGSFQGFAAVAGPEGLDGLRPGPHGGPPSTTPTPAGLLTWDRIDAVEVRVHGWRAGALIGGLALGALGGALGYQEGTTGLLEAHGPLPPLELAAATLYGFGLGATIGVAFGAPFGWLTPAWQRIYSRPKVANHVR